MQVGRLREIIKDYKDEDELVVIFYERSETDLHLEDGEVTDEQWSKIVQEVQNDNQLTQLADQVFYETVFSVTE